MEAGVSLPKIFSGLHIHAQDGMMAFKHEKVEAKGMEHLEGLSKRRSLTVAQLCIVSNDAATASYRSIPPVIDGSLSKGMP